MVKWRSRLQIQITGCNAISGISKLSAMNTFILRIFAMISVDIKWSAMISSTSEISAKIIFASIMSAWANAEKDQALNLPAF